MKYIWKSKSCQKYYLKNKKRILERSKERKHRWYLRNKERLSKRSRARYQKNKKRILKRCHEYYTEHRGQALVNSKRWREVNVDRFRELARLRYRRDRIKILRELRKRKERDPHFRLKHNVYSMIHDKLKRRGVNKNKFKDGKSAFSVLPYTPEQLMAHLEKLFAPGMTWRNYGKWHIDHKIADCKFKYKSINDLGFKQSWALKNLQPLWAHDNLVKNKY